MKTITKLLALAFLLSLIFAGCEKDPLQPDKNAMRILRIADNSAMLEPSWEFEYDLDGRLVGITGDDNNGTTTIIYNSEDLPEMITWVTDNFSYDDDSDYDTTHIVWGNNSFVLDDEIFTLDENGNVTNISWDAGSRGYEATWQEDRVEVNFYREDGLTELVTTRVFNEYNSPLSVINLAILNASYVSWVDDDGDYSFQNKYCIKAFNSDEGISDFDYEVNENGYPTKLTETMDGETVRVFYFEYETK